MAQSDLVHGEPISLSEETTAVVNCIMVRMTQLLTNLLANPGYAPTRQEDLEALLRQGTVMAISECDLKPPHLEGPTPAHPPLSGSLPR